MLNRRRKLFYWIFKLSSVLIACALPIWAVCERYPVWTEIHGTTRSIGAGGILILLVLLVVFRKTVFDFLSEHLKLKHAPPVFVWCIMLVVSYILVFIANFMRDMTSVFWMGLIGCAVGNVLTFIAEDKFGEESKE